MAPPPPPRIAQRPAATPAPTFASEIYASTEEHELPMDVQEKPVARKKSREEKRESVMSVVPAPEPVAVQPPPPPPAPAPAPRAEEPLRVTPPAEPLRITPSEPLRITPSEPLRATASEPLRITPSEPLRATASEPLRITPSEPLRVANEPLRITPPREPEPERVHGAYVPTASAEPKPELVAVPASVFDDDFFRKPNEELRTGAPEARGWTKEPSRELESVAAAQKSETHWPEAKVPSFAGYAGGSSSSSEEDELDIPAFLRRSR
jgi:hypothetical protein